MSKLIYIPTFLGLFLPDDDRYVLLVWRVVGLGLVVEGGRLVAERVQAQPMVAKAQPMQA